MFLLLFSISIFAKATITVSVWSWNVDRYKKLITEFNKYYPDIEVKLVVNEPEVNSFLTARASAKQALPDVIAESWEP
ncbi:MAG TPA: hypothetical protein PK390_01385 [Fervidobacterium nodosum]|nr:hypothetical protein [Fervidobacterium nodosum]